MRLQLRDQLVERQREQAINRREGAIAGLPCPHHCCPNHLGPEFRIIGLHISHRICVATDAVDCGIDTVDVQRIPAEATAGIIEIENHQSLLEFLAEFLHRPVVPCFQRKRHRRLAGISDAGEAERVDHRGVFAGTRRSEYHQMHRPMFTLPDQVLAVHRKARESIL